MIHDTRHVLRQSENVFELEGITILFYAYICPWELESEVNTSSYCVPLKSNILFKPQEIILPKGL